MQVTHIQEEETGHNNKRGVEKSETGHSSAADDIQNTGSSTSTSPCTFTSYCLRTVQFYLHLSVIHSQTDMLSLCYIRAQTLEDT